MMNQSLHAIAVLLVGIVDTLVTEQDILMAAGYGRTDADPADLARLKAVMADLGDAQSALSALRNHAPS